MHWTQYLGSVQPSSSQLVEEWKFPLRPCTCSTRNWRRASLQPAYCGFQPLSASSKAVIPTTASFSAVSLLLSCVVLQSCLIIFPLFYLCIQPLSIACEELLST
uniref:Uncharacterized protein n=1 Tax=Setaria viridis TaxID=4556 RepID=A0A4U6UU37_SETVI|nr:hypothetical protein SEVIR_5G178966v2 [Setaria viridis]